MPTILDVNFGREFFGWPEALGKTRPKNSLSKFAIKIRWEIRRQFSSNSPDKNKNSPPKSALQNVGINRRSETFSVSLTIVATQCFGRMEELENTAPDWQPIPPSLRGWTVKQVLLDNYPFNQGPLNWGGLGCQGQQRQTKSLPCLLHREMLWPSPPGFTLKN